MGFSETIFLFFLALLIFGPKKLPEVARQVGKILNEFRRASNEFRSQIAAEISQLEMDHHQQILPPSQPPVGAVQQEPKVIEASAPSQSQEAEPPVTNSPIKVAPDA